LELDEGSGLLIYGRSTFVEGRVGSVLPLMLLPLYDFPDMYPKVTLKFREFIAF